MAVAIRRAGVILALASALAIAGVADAQVHSAPPQVPVTIGPPVDSQARALDLELGLVPPSPDILFRAESEPEYLERLRKEALQKNIKLVFPKDSRPASPPAVAISRNWPEQIGICPFASVCHYPLYFEDPMAERYGWYVPGLQPAISAGKFWLDTVLLPCKMVANPPCEWQCDSPWPAPGDQVSFSWSCLGLLP